MTFDPKDPVREALEAAIGFQYDIIRLLGRGGMGAVYHAHERALDRPVAIKVLPPEVAGTGDARERFLREARTAARLTHPNIVPLYTFGETSGLVYYVMGYVEGESLQQRLDRLGALDPQEVVRILQQLAAALEYAHQQGIVHRDVKPDNVLLERGAGTVKLTDFGIARRAAAGETLTGTGLVVGSPRYMSPEQAAGDREVDGRADVYALGLVGYAMVNGRPPFEGDSVQDLLRQQIAREAPNLRKALPEVPSQIAKTIQRALEKDPAARWPSAGAMGASLNEDDELAGMGKRRGAYAVATVAYTAFYWNLAWLSQWVFDSRPWVVGLMVAVPIVTMALGLLGEKYIEKKTASEFRSYALEPPRWWPYWWPETWRAADDVWKRLPEYVRETKKVSTLGVTLFALAMQSTIMAFAVNKRIPDEWVGSWVYGTLASFVLSGATLGVAAWRTWAFAKLRGIKYEVATLFHGAGTGRPAFFAKPQIAPLLSPVTAEPREPSSPTDLAKRIEDEARALPEHTDAGSAARELAQAVDALDGEIARLSREADPAEAARLETKMAAPGNEEMRKLYASQLELLRRLIKQRGELDSRRSRYIELLRTLWLQITALRAQRTVDAAGVADLTGRIRAILQSVRHEVDAAREAAAILQP